MNSPKISVIIPVYNVEKYLQTCIDSLLSQSMKEIEFIFVNDASPDGSLAILQENQRLHPDQIRIIDSKVNLKQGGARNLGIAAAQAPLIGFLDSDDFCRSGYVSGSLCPHVGDGCRCGFYTIC